MDSQQRAIPTFNLESIVGADKAILATDGAMGPIPRLVTAVPSLLRKGTHAVVDGRKWILKCTTLFRQLVVHAFIGCLLHVSFHPYPPRGFVIQDEVLASLLK